MRDMKSNMDVVESIGPANYTATVTGAGVDLRDFDGAMIVYHGNNGDFITGNEAYTPSVEESDDDSTYNVVAAGDLEGTLSDLRTTEVQRVGYKGNKRYIRGVLTLAGTTPIIDASALVMRGHPHQAPVA